MKYLSLCFAFLFSASSAFAVSIKSSAAQATYEFWRSQRCEQANSKETKILQRASIESPTCQSSINAKVPAENIRQIDDLNEDLFFNFAAAKQVDVLNCHLLKLKKYTDENSTDAKEFRAMIVKDIADKIPTLRSLHDQIEKLSQQINESEHYLVSRGATKDGNARAIESIHKAREAIAKLADPYAKIYSSIWSSDEPSMAAYLKKVIESDISPEDFMKQALQPAPGGVTGFFKKNFSFNDAVLKEMQKTDQKDLASLQAQSKKDAQGKVTYHLNQTTKELIVKRGDTLELLAQNKDLTKENLKGLACRLDARYGEGTEDLSNALLVGSLVIGGSGSLLKIGALSKMAAASLSSEETGLLYGAGRVLVATSTAASIPIEMIQVQNACQTSPGSFRTDACENPKTSEFVSLESKKLSQMNCLLSLALGKTYNINATRVIGKNIAPNLYSELEDLSVAAKTKVSDSLKVVVRKVNPTAVFKTSKQILGKRKAEPIWKSYSDEFAVNAATNINNKSKAVFEEAIKKNHPQIAFLKSVGYEFEVADGKLQSVKVPPMSKIIDTVDERMGNLIKTRKVSPDDVLLPARVFKNDKDEILALRYGEKVPTNFAPYDGFVEPSAYAKIVSQGLFPIGESTKILHPGTQSAAEHDLGHLSTFLEHPDYMAAYRKAMTEVAKKSGTSAEMDSRIFQMSETIEYQNPKMAAQFDELMKSHHINLPEGNVTADQVEKALAGKSVAELKSLTNDLSAKLYMEPVGGAQRDIVTFAAGKQPLSVQEPQGRVQFLKNMMVYLNEKELRSGLAGAITGMVDSRKLNVAEAMTEAAKPEINKKSLTYYYFCLSGAFSESSISYRSFCMGK